MAGALLGGFLVSTPAGLHAVQGKAVRLLLGEGCSLWRFAIAGAAQQHAAYSFADVFFSVTLRKGQGVRGIQR